MPWLLGFLVLSMSIAKPAIFLERKLVGRSPLVLGGVIVTPLALRAGQGD
jgi:hypothetical protein